MAVVEDVLSASAFEEATQASALVSVKVHLALQEASNKVLADACLVASVTPSLLKQT